jgi:hypothetical protein
MAEEKLNKGLGVNDEGRKVKRKIDGILTR